MKGRIAGDIAMKDKLRQAESKGPSESYSKFRVRWRHVLVIDQQVRAGRAPNCRRLAEELEVSRRTVLRDVDFMRYDLSAPIEYENLGKSERAHRVRKSGKIWGHHIDYES
jgi:hypothetical protein